MYIVVYQLLVQTCKHAPVVEGEKRTLYEEDGSETVSYKNFTTLWIHILTLPREHAVCSLHTF